MTQSAKELTIKVRQVLKLSDDLRREPWRGAANPFAGHCYVASEALFHLLGGKKAGWTPQVLKHEGFVHWWFRHRGGTIIDVTSAQFRTSVPYHLGRGIGFLTKKPSKRTRELMARLTSVTGWSIVFSSTADWRRQCLI